MSLTKFIVPAMAAMAITACGSKATQETADDFDYTVDRFADIEVLRYKVPDFENLTPQQRILIYYLTEAAITGRDILSGIRTANTTSLSATSSKTSTPTSTATARATNSKASNST